MKISTHHIATTVHGRCLIASPDWAAPTGWLVGFHGYAESAQEQLERLLPIAPDGWGCCSVQALHPFYRKDGSIVASWMTKLDRELAIEDNVNYIRQSIEAIRGSTHEPPVWLVGFSQGAAMAFRAAFFVQPKVDGVIAVGGELPPELRSLPAPAGVQLLLCRGSDDPHYTQAQWDADIAILRSNGAMLDTLEYRGEHPWNDILQEKLRCYLGQ
ncbi:MAG: hypothetical protein KDD69_14690 [Bdellovibrionales bacterium]|nr:hypothetical protein [Bdellovibrionales bacterium]